MLDWIRLIMGIVLLSYASYTDWKSRKVDNKIWIIMGISGVILIPLSDFDIWIFLPILLMTGIAFMIYILNIFGGADIKALIAISILTPSWPEMAIMPYSASIYFFPLVIFNNSLILYLSIPLYYCLYNLIKRNCEWPYCFLGYKINAKKALKKYVWPMEAIKNGKKFKTIFPDKNQKIEDFGNDMIWVTPKIPFIIPLLGGFITAFFIGDILSLVWNLIT
jgi:preflagellin peptidase FlaK